MKKKFKSKQLTKLYDEATKWYPTPGVSACSSINISFINHKGELITINSQSKNNPFLESK